MKLIKEAYVDLQEPDFFDMIREARSRGVRTEDIFQVPSDAVLLEPQEFFQLWEKGNKVKIDYYKTRKTVLYGDRYHREALEGYLDSISIKTPYRKLIPCSVWENGRVDGKHRGLLAYYLGIKVPVIKEK